MKKLRFFESILLEALDQRIIIVINCHRKALKTAEKDISTQQQEIERAVQDAANALIIPKTSGIIEYKVKEQYKIETEILQKARTIIWKNMLELELEILKESLTKLREILSNELQLLETSNQQTHTAAKIHNEIITKIPIYSKSLNAIWEQIEIAIKILAIINSKSETINEDDQILLEQISSIQSIKTEGKIQYSIKNNNYNENVTKLIELYFKELNDEINYTIKKKTK